MARIDYRSIVIERSLAQRFEQAATRENRTLRNWLETIALNNLPEDLK